MKEIIVLGDVEIGGGTLTDDFISDKALSNLILELADRKHAVDLVFNGDTFDFLKCPIVVKYKRKFPRHVTEEISLQKLKLMYDAHKKVFIAMKMFAATKGKHIYFVFGNHDHDLMFPGVREELKRIISTPLHVHFPGLKYQYKQVIAEHGHMYDYLNKIDPVYWYMTYKGKRILNIPWVSLSIVSNFMYMKEAYPFMERIHPRTELFSNHSNLLKKINLKFFATVAENAIYFPLRYRFDPTYTFPKEIFRELYRRYKNAHLDVDDVMIKFRKKVKKRKRKFKLHILGHVHERFLDEKEGQVFIHPGTWRDEYDLDQETLKLTPRAKSYVQVIVDGDDLSYELVTLPNERKVLNFDIVKMDEHSHIEMVRKEES